MKFCTGVMHALALLKQGNKNNETLSLLCQFIFQAGSREYFAVG